MTSAYLPKSINVTILWQYFRMGKITKQQVIGTIEKAIMTATESQEEAGIEYIARLRRVHPEKTPLEIAGIVKSNYIKNVTISGAAAGSTAVLPTGVSIGASLVDLGNFIRASAKYVLTMAELTGLHTEDLERKNTLVLICLFGDKASKAAIGTLIPKGAGRLGNLVVKKIPRNLIKEINKALWPRFITIAGKSGTVVLTKHIPLFIGTVLGGAANTVFARSMIKASSKVLDPVVSTWVGTKFDSTLES